MSAVHRRAILHLKRADAALGRAIARVGPCRFAPQTDGTHFDFIIKSIVYQQLSGKAAATIHRRVLELFAGAGATPHSVAAVKDQRLREAGLSRQKASYLKDLALKVDAGEVRLGGIESAADEDALAELTKVKGIGRWSAQMFLMFRLGRPDILPEGDLGIRKAVQQVYGLRRLPSPERVRRIGRPWSPHATIASWYLWRHLDGPAG
jgi:DNA-3-methyladenine glycosylase II